MNVPLASFSVCLCLFLFLFAPISFADYYIRSPSLIQTFKWHPGWRNIHRTTKRYRGEGRGVGVKNDERGEEGLETRNTKRGEWKSRAITILMYILMESGMVLMVSKPINTFFFPFLRFAWAALECAASNAECCKEKLQRKEQTDSWC